MILRLKICFTIFALYEIAAIMLLHCQRTCDAMFSTTFCDTGFKYFIFCIAVPVLAYLIFMWIREIFVGHHRHSLTHKAGLAVRGVFDNVRDRISENVSTKDLEKILAAALVIGVKKYADSHPHVRDAFKDIIHTAAPEYEYVYDYADEDIDHDADMHPMRPKPKAKPNARAKKRK